MTAFKFGNASLISWDWESLSIFHFHLNIDMNESEIPNRQSTTSVIDGTRVQCWHGVERFRAWGPWTWSWVPKALTKAPPLAHNHTILVTTLQVLRPYGSAPGPQLRPRALPLSSLLVPLNALQCILWGHQTPPSATGIGISFVSCNHIWSPFEIGTTRIQTDISSIKQFKVEAEKTKVVAKFFIQDDPQVD